MTREQGVDGSPVVLRQPFERDDLQRRNTNLELREPEQFRDGHRQLRPERLLDRRTGPGSPTRDFRLADKRAGDRLYDQAEGS